MDHELHGSGDQPLVATAVAGAALVNRIPAAGRRGNGGGSEMVSSRIRNLVEPQLVQSGGCELDGVRQAINQEVPINARRHLGHQRTRQFGELRAPVGMAEIGLLGERRHEVFGQWHGALDALLERLATFLSDQRIGVVTFGQKQEADLSAVARLGQGVAERAPGGSAASLVTVEAEDDLVHQLEDAPQVLGVVAVPSVATA
jgi:hypothetical protein